MSEKEGTGATPDPNAKTPDPNVTPDPREEDLGDKGKELLREMRQTIKDLSAQVKTVADRTTADDEAKAAAEAAKEADKEAKSKAEADKDKSTEEKLQERLDAMQDRLVKREFKDAAREAGILNATAANDLFALVKDEIAGDPDRVPDVIKAQLEARPNFFTEKKGTKGHDGGTTGKNKGPALTADEKRFARLIPGVSDEDYLGSK